MYLARGRTLLAITPQRRLRKVNRYMGFSPRKPRTPFVCRGPKRFRNCRKTPFTKSWLPKATPFVKYRTRRRTYSTGDTTPLFCAAGDDLHPIKSRQFPQDLDESLFAQVVRVQVQVQVQLPADHAGNAVIYRREVPSILIRAKRNVFSSLSGLLNRG